MERIDAIVFDLDGTLLNTLDDLAASVNHALRAQGFPERSRKEVRRFLGNGIRHLVQLSLPEGQDEAALERTLAEFRSYYMAHCLDLTKPYEGIMELMKELRKRKVKVAVVSNKIDAAVKELCQKFFGDYVLIAIGESESVRRKPCPDGVQAALGFMGVKVENALYVGDSEVDVATAAAANMRCAAVTWGFRDYDGLVKAGATCIVDSPCKLLELLAGQV